MLHRLPVVSVVIPVRNGARYLRLAVESIQAQSLRDFELIIVDDGSTDGTPELLRELAARDPRISLHRQDARGLVSALQYAIGLSQCSILARMDSDDIALPDRLERQLAAFEARKDLVALGGQVLRIDDQGRALGVGNYPVGSKLTKERLRLSSPICHPAAMVRASALARIGGYREAYRHAEDYDLWLRLADIGEIDNLPSQVLEYRVHGAGTTGSYPLAQAMNAALALVAADARRRGLPDSALAAAKNADDLSAALSAAGIDGAEAQRARLAYWRVLAINGGIAKPTVMAAFRRVLLSLALSTCRLDERAGFVFMMLRAAMVAGVRGSKWTAAACLLLSIAVAPVHTTRETCQYLIARVGKRRWMSHAPRLSTAVLSAVNR